MSRKEIAGVLVICGYVHIMVPGKNPEEKCGIYMNPTLTKTYRSKGQKGLDLEIVRLVLDGAMLIGTDPSICKYQKFFALDVVKQTMLRYKYRISEIEKEVDRLLRSGCMTARERDVLLAELLNKATSAWNTDVLVLANYYLGLDSLGEKRSA